MMGIVMGVWLALVTAIAMIAIHMAAIKLVLAVFLLVGVAHIATRYAAFLRVLS